MISVVDQSQPNGKTLMSISVELLQKVNQRKSFFFVNFIFFFLIINSLHLHFTLVLPYSCFYVHGYQTVHQLYKHFCRLKTAFHMYVKWLIERIFINFSSFFKLISQICAESTADDRELVIQSLCSFGLGLCLVFNNSQIQEYSA